LSLTSSFGNSFSEDFEKLKSLQGKWQGTLERTDGTSDSFELNYSVTSNGSALLEESDTGGIEMLTIFNVQNNELLSTHYCALQNKPVSVLKSAAKGEFIFITDSKRSGLSTEKEAFVTSWKISLMPEDSNTIHYQYTVTGPEGVVFVATSVLKRA
jgi:glutamine phosphoribosylpyrophosphate amidotransferase